MYTPKQFQVDHDTASQIVAQIRAADLVTVTDDGLEATYLPFLFDPERGTRGTLIGHLARLNDQWKKPTRGEALVIAHGLDTYISPAWYPSKAAHGRVVPTWNYATAHIYGELVVHDDVEWLEEHVRRLTDHHESARDDPWSVDDAPAAFIAGQLRAIVGIEVVVSRIEVKLKMSQNRPDADIDGVVSGLTAAGREDVAELVERSRR